MFINFGAKEAQYVLHFESLEYSTLWMNAEFVFSIDAKLELKYLSKI